MGKDVAAANFGHKSLNISGSGVLSAIASISINLNPGSCLPFSISEMVDWSVPIFSASTVWLTPLAILIVRMRLPNLATMSLDMYRVSALLSKPHIGFSQYQTKVP